MEARSRVGDVTVATATTDAAGAFALLIPTGGVPFDGYLTLTKSGYLSARAYISKPIANHLQIGTLFTTTSSVLNLLFSLYGLSPAPGTGIAIVSVRDCTLTSVQDSQIVARQNLAGVGSGFNPGLGFGTWVVDVPAGTTTFSAISGGFTLSGVDVSSIAGQLTFIVVIP